MNTRQFIDAALQAAYRLEQPAQLLFYSPPQPPFGDMEMVQRREVDDLLRQIQHNIDKTLTLGLPVGRESYVGGGRAGWDFDMRQTLPQLRDGALKLVDIAGRGPSLPWVNPNDPNQEEAQRRFHEALQAQQALRPLLESAIAELRRLYWHVRNLVDQIDPNPAVTPIQATADAQSRTPSISDRVAAPYSIPTIFRELRYTVEKLGHTLRHLRQLDESDAARRAHQLLANACRGDWPSVEALATRLLPDDAAWLATWEAVCRELRATIVTAATDPDAMPCVEVGAGEGLVKSDFLRERLPSGELRDGEVCEAPPYAPASTKKRSSKSKKVPASTNKRTKSKNAPPPAASAEVVASAASKTAAMKEAGKGELAKMIEPHPTKDEGTHARLDRFAEQSAEQHNAIVAELRALRSEQPAATNVPRAPTEDVIYKGLTLAAGGYSYCGKPHILTGQPRDMLVALLGAFHHRMTADDLCDEIEVDEYSENRVQVVKDVAVELRKSLRVAIEHAGKRCDDPLPSSGKGKDLTYRLELP